MSVIAALNWKKKMNTSKKKIKHKYLDTVVVFQHCAYAAFAICCEGKSIPFCGGGLAVANSNQTIAESKDPL